MFKLYARRAFDATHASAAELARHDIQLGRSRTAGLGARDLNACEMLLEGIDDVLELRAHEQLRDHRTAWFQYRRRESQRAIYQLARARLVARGNPGQLRRKVARYKICASTKLSIHARSDFGTKDV